MNRKEQPNPRHELEDLIEQQGRNSLREDRRSRAASQSS